MHRNCPRSLPAVTVAAASLSVGAAHAVRGLCPPASCRRIPSSTCSAASMTSTRTPRFDRQQRRYCLRRTWPASCSSTPISNCSAVHREGACGFGELLHGPSAASARNGAYRRCDTTIRVAVQHGSGRIMPVTRVPMTEQRAECYAATYCSTRPRPDEDVVVLPGQDGVRDDVRTRSRRHEPRGVERRKARFAGSSWPVELLRPSTSKNSGTCGVGARAVSALYAC